MFCAVDCFVDVELRQILQSHTIKGKCDFTNRNNVEVFEITNQLQYQFEGLISIYETPDRLPKTFPKDKLDYIANILLNEWNIFDITIVNKGIVEKIIIEICRDKYLSVPELFTKKVGLAEMYDQDFIEDYSIFKSSSWEHFINEIKTTNRFHIEMVNKGILEEYIKQAESELNVNDSYYRGRLNPNKEIFSAKDMTSPPPNLASAGRANPEGISYLYLADNEETVIHEVRSALLDYISIAKFKTTEPLTIIDFTKFDKISPFYAKEPFYEAYVINLKHIKKIANEVARPLRRHESRLDYLPTQYIIEYIKKLGYDGIKYKSSMREGGFNYAIFDKEKFTITNIKLYEIDNIKYTFRSIKK